MLLCINNFVCLDLLILNGILLTSHLLVGHMFKITDSSFISGFVIVFMQSI